MASKLEGLEMSRSACDKNMVLLIVFIFAFIVFSSWLTFNKFEHNMWDGHDQGAYCQMLWTTMHGKLFWCSVTGINGACDLAIHMNVLMFLLIPVYWIFNFPVTLNIIQVLYLGIAAIPVYLIAKEKMSSKVGLLFAVFYLTNNFTIQSIIEGFQPRSMAVPLSLFGFYFLIKNKYFLTSLFMCLLALSQESNSMLLITFGIYIILIQRQILLGALISFFGLGWFMLTINILQPHFGVSNPLGVLQFDAAGTILVSPLEIIRYFIFHPIEFFQRALSYPKLDYFVRLFAPLAFLSLFSLKELLIALPVFLQNFILGGDRFIRPENPRHTMPLLPFILISAIYSASYFYSKPKLRWKYIWVFLVICWGISTYKFVWDYNYNQRFLKALAPVTQEEKIHRQALRKIVKLVPADASICGDLKAFPFLANRFTFYDIPFHIEDTDYVLIDTKDPNFSAKPIKSREECLEIIAETLRSTDYTVIKEEDGLVLLKRIIR